MNQIANAKSIEAYDLNEFQGKWVKMGDSWIPVVFRVEIDEEDDGPNDCPECGWPLQFRRDHFYCDECGYEF